MSNRRREAHRDPGPEWYTRRNLTHRGAALEHNPNLPFEAKEYQSRVERTLEAMQERGLDGLMIHSPENIYYLTGYHSVGYFTYTALVLTPKGATIVLRDLISSMVRHSSWVDDVKGWTDVQDPIATTKIALDDAGLIGKNVGYDEQAWFYNIGHHKALTESCPSTNFVETAGLVEKVRRFKSEQEIAYIREAARTCKASMQGCIDAIEEGATENDAAAAAYYESIKAGSEYLGHAILVATGSRTGLGFATWERTPISRGDLIYLEVGGTYKRYNAAMSRGVAVGEPSDLAKRLADGSRGALERAIEAMQPGATSAAVDRAARGYMEQQGLADYFRHRCGYLIGIGFPPDWGEGRLMSIIENDDTPLEPGLVFHLVPDVRIDGEIGVIYSDTVLVTESGPEVLTDFPRDLVIK